MTCHGISSTNYEGPGAVACWHKSFGRRLPVPPLHLPKFGFRPNYKEENTAPPIRIKLDWRFIEHGLAHQTKTPFSPQPVPPIGKLLQASYPHPSEGRQNENHSHKNLTKLIAWATGFSNSMKLWAMPCRATQDGWVMMESSDKTWSTRDGNGKPLQHSFLENPMNSRKRQKDRAL